MKRTSEREISEHKALNEQRRPGYSSIYDRLRAANPTWHHNEVMAHAKQEWSQRWGPLCIPNPDQEAMQ
jgi:hypothetical protein